MIPGGGSIFGDAAQEVSTGGDDDDYSLLSGITAGTSATVRGVRNVSKSLADGLLSALETPGPVSIQRKVGLDLSKTKLPYTTPEGVMEAPARVATPPAQGSPSLQSLHISTPESGVKAESTVDPALSVAAANDPTACQAWLFEADKMSDLCFGTIGKKGLVCVDKACDCSIKSHKSHKTPLKDNTWYLLTKNDTVQISPGLPNSIASRSNLWAMYRGQMYTPASWSSIFAWIHSNDAAVTPSELVSEADSIRLLQGGTTLKGAVPKTPKLYKLSNKPNDVIPVKEFEEGVRVGFKTAEESLTDLYSEVAKLSSRVGLPSDPATSHGSCYGDIEKVYLYASSIEDSVAANSVILQRHNDALIKCDEKFSTYEGSINQAVASSLSAASAARSAQNVVQGFQSTGTLNKVHVQGESIEDLQKQVSFLKNELTGVYDLVKEIINKVPAMGQSGASAAQGHEIDALKGELQSLRSHTASQLKVMKQSMEGHGPVSLGSWRFDSAEACHAQLLAWGVTASSYERFFDPPHLLAALLYRSKSHKEVSDQAVLTMKTTLSAAQITSIASNETTVPEIFSGSVTAASPGVETSKLTSVFGAIKTFDLFDSGDGETGVLNYIRLGLRDFLPQQQQEAEALFSVTHPEFLMFIGLLRDRAAAALEDLLREMGELYRNLLARVCGYCTSYKEGTKGRGLAASSHSPSSLLPRGV
eukprot:scaffold22211_cov38-Cyclotella_meneghiniana.AAC.3